MSIRTTFIVLCLISLLSLGFGLWAGQQMPERVPSHWDAAGNVNGYASRNFAIFFVPALTLAIGALILFLPMIDPLRANVEKFRKAYNWVVIGFAVYMTYIQVITVLAAIGIAYNMTLALIPAFAAMLIGLGFLMERTQPNWFIGIRTPWTLSSPIVWEKSHKVGGWLFKAGGILCLVGLFLPPEIAFLFIMFPIFIAAFGAVIYSYFAYRKLNKGS